MNNQFLIFIKKDISILRLLYFILNNSNNKIIKIYGEMDRDDLSIETLLELDF